MCSNNGHDLPSIHESVGYWTSRMAREMEAQFDNRLSGYGMTRTGFAVLGGIVFDGKNTPTELAAFLGLDKAVVSRVLENLETLQLISRRHGTHDRRMVHIYVEDTGREMAAKLSKESRQINQQFTSEISLREIEQYIETIKKMAKNGGANLNIL